MLLHDLVRSIASACRETQHCSACAGADMLNAPRAMEAGRCYTEILQLVKPRPDKVNLDGPLWRLRGPTFGPLQRSAGQGALLSQATAVSAARGCKALVTQSDGECCFLLASSIAQSFAHGSSVRYAWDE